MSLKRLSVCLAALALSGVAQAADLPSRKDALVPSAPAFTWAGFYAGAYAGYEWGRTRVIDTGVLAEAGAPTNGGVGGALAGYNWQFDKIVLGLEGDIGFADLRGHGVKAIIAQPVRSYDVSWTADLRMRAGYVIEPRTLIFVAGGLAVADFNFHDPSTPAVFSVGAKFTGWTIGGGHRPRLY